MRVHAFGQNGMAYDKRQLFETDVRFAGISFAGSGDLAIAYDRFVCESWCSYLLLLVTQRCSRVRVCVRRCHFVMRFER